MKFLIKFIIIFFCFSSFVYPQDLINPIAFTDEIIALQIDTLESRLKGIYYFKNYSNIEQNISIAYPFCINDKLTYPSKIIIKDSIKNSPINFISLDKAIIFNLKFLPNEKKIIIIEYFQSTIFNYFKYILLSTKNWKTKFASARYELTIPEYLDIESSTLPFTTFKNENENKKHFFVEYENFMPENNMIIKWRKK